MRIAKKSDRLLYEVHSMSHLRPAPAFYRVSPDSSLVPRLAFPLHIYRPDPIILLQATCSLAGHFLRADRLPCHRSLFLLADPLSSLIIFLNDLYPFTGIVSSLLVCGLLAKMQCPAIAGPWPRSDAWQPDLAINRGQLKPVMTCK
jgi:hypothetical protein